MNSLDCVLFRIQQTVDSICRCGGGYRFEGERLKYEQLKDKTMVFIGGKICACPVAYTSGTCLCGTCVLESLTRHVFSGLA